jgi:leader peptidase (prepilin peptidase)/N-methyltransferase
MAEALETLFGPPVGYVLAFVWGALWGSFYNVMVVWGTGRRASLVRPASHCLECQTPIRAWDNIPLVSYLVLRGRCRACGARFSPRYFVIEAATAGLTLLLYWHVVAAAPEAPLPGRLAVFLLYEKFAGLLVVLSAIDLELLIIPDRITYPAIPAAMALSLLLPLPRWWDGLVGAVAGYAFVWLVAEAYWLIRRREGMGLGDAKLLAIIGAILGWRALPYVVFLAALQGSIIGIVGVLAGARLGPPPESEPEPEPPPEPPPAGAASPAAPAAPPAPTPLRFAAVPFGPFLALGALEYLFFGERLVAAYTSALDALTRAMY